ncbi:MAG: DMT family transporter [Kiloniellales bacterium]|nr:DMT family transporter [Kiloniellales bacterium]
MRQLPDHAKGMLITVAGVLAVSPDSLLIRLVSADFMTLMFWRGLLVSMTLVLGLLAAHKARTPARFGAIGWPGIVFAGLFSLSSFSFVLAVETTTVANTLVLISAAPFFAAVIARLFLGERVRRQTWLAILAAFAGIVVIVSGSLGGGALVGDLAALVTALGLAIQFNVLRRHRHVNMIPAIALGNLMTAFVSLPLAATLWVAPLDALWLGLLGIVVMPVGAALITTGPRYLPAPEVSLILLLETVLGPFWVWLALGEVPSDRSLLGGAIVIAALAGHAIAALHRSVAKDVGSA